MFRPVKTRQHLTWMVAKGYSANAVLAGSGITLEALQDPACLIDMRQYKAIVGNVLKLTGDHGIGLEFGGKTELMDLGMLGHLVMSAQTTRQATYYWINYSHELLGEPFSIELQENSPKEWALEFSELVPLGRILNFCVEEQFMMIYKLSGKIVPAEPMLKLVELSYPRPPHGDLYEKYFRAPIKFNAAKTRITILTHRLDYPLLDNDKEFHEICQRQCELMIRKIHQDDSMASRIKRVLMRFKGGNPGMEAVAREMKISARTLRRHLGEEGYTYQKLVDEFCIELAQEYLRSDSISPKEIGYLLGFSHPASFYRAFKRWSGVSINQFRNQNLQKSQASDGVGQ